MEFPAEYMFKEVPTISEEGQDPVEVTFAAMDQRGIAIGMVGPGGQRADTRALDVTPTASWPAWKSTPTTSPTPCARSARPMRVTASWR